jgi:hypothetical protein
MGLVKAPLVHPRRQFAENETPNRRGRFQAGKNIFSLHPFGLKVA